MATTMRWDGRARKGLDCSYVCGYSLDMGKTHTENRRTGRALCGAQLTGSNHGWNSNGETCQKCANASERARERRVTGKEKM